MTDTYLTVSEEAHITYTTQNSRFIGSAAPCLSEEEAISFITRIRQKYIGASHYCYAYVISKNSIMRFTDDGEPSGTAGLPILNVLKQKELTNSCAVVTRYYGGIPLGKSGLIRAYTRSCASAVDAAGIVYMELCEQWECAVPYPLWDKTRRFLEALPLRLETPVFTERVHFVLCIGKQDSSDIMVKLKDITSGLLHFQQTGMFYAPRDNRNRL